MKGLFNSGMVSRTKGYDCENGMDNDMEASGSEIGTAL